MICKNPPENAKVPTLMCLQSNRAENAKFGNEALSTKFTYGPAAYEDF